MCVCGGDGDWLESLAETRSIFVRFFFACVVGFVWFGGCGWGGDRLESPVEIIQILCGFFFACVVVFVWFEGGGGKLLI